MSKFRISEFSHLQTAAGVGHAAESAQIPMHPQVVVQAPITLSGVSQKSQAFNANTNFVLLDAEAACHFVVGVDPVATTDSERLLADNQRYIGVPPGYKIAVIAAA